MAKPNTLIFVDFPSPDPAASARFYTEVFGWECEPRPADVFYRIVPGGHFALEDNSPSPIGNLHMGIYDAAGSGDGKSTKIRVLGLAISVMLISGD